MPGMVIGMHKYIMKSVYTYVPTNADPWPKLSPQMVFNWAAKNWKFGETKLEWKFLFVDFIYK